MNSKNYAILLSLALVGMMIGVWSEISTLWTIEQNWAQLLSLKGTVAISLYIVLLLFGLFFIINGSWRVETLNNLTRKLNLSLAIRWTLVVGLLFVFTYIYLFSVWQPSLSQPWIQLLFAMSFAQIILFVIAPQCEQKFGWSEVASALGLFLYPRMIQEMRALFTNATIYRAATLTGFAIILGLIFVLYSNYSEKIRFGLVAWRERLGSVRFGVVVLLCLTPIVHRYLVSPETYIIYDDIRFSILIVAVWLVAYLGLTGSDRLVSPEALGLSLGVLSFTSFLALSSLFIINYPFSLSWSEGNRFYDYSLVFGQSLYNYKGQIVSPYVSPGRYGLWGIPFLWQGLPIWAHRLWNLLLQTVPVLIFAILLTRKLTPPVLRYGVLIWITLFLTMLAPLHPPFVIASVIAVLFAFESSLAKRGISLAIASFYAGLSRWTWAFAPTAIGVLVELMLYYPKRTGPFWRRVLPLVLLASISLAAGLIPSQDEYLSVAQGESTASGQPLLWYRLLPNNTLGPGVLFLALRYTLPLLIILAWWMMSRRWRLDWVQKVALWGVLIGFFGIGLVISTKIGGGGDLHNLDMFLITALVAVVLGLMAFDISSVQGRWPVWAVGLIFYLVFWVVYPFTPLHPSSSYHPFLELPKEEQVADVLSITQNEVAKYAKSGEVLFMDDRQLLVFGYIPSIPFVPEYEKKYMMDQAMASNASYFQSYYQDLAKKRFALIVTEPLKTRRREDLGGPFSEENDAWVLWVSNPTLCFYEPVYLATAVNVELLVPKQNPVGCEQYLKQ
ncbi:MAG TPA: hypothetical protein VF918_10320 [Anaerolineales bacterium]